MQTEDEDRIGFIERKKYRSKAEYKQYDQLLCSRCVSLSHGRMIPGVMDLHQQATHDDTAGLMSPDDFRDQLMVSCIVMQGYMSIP